VDGGTCWAILQWQGTKGPDVWTIAAEGMWDHGQELAARAVLVAAEVSNLRRVLEHKHLDLVV